MGSGASTHPAPIAGANYAASVGHAATDVVWKASGPVGVNLMAHDRDGVTHFLVIVRHTLQGLLMDVTEKTPLHEVRVAVRQQQVCPVILGKKEFLFALPNGARLTTEQEKSLTLGFILCQEGESPFAYAGRLAIGVDNLYAEKETDLGRLHGAAQRQPILNAKAVVPAAGTKGQTVAELAAELSDSEDEGQEKLDSEGDLVVISYSSEQNEFLKEICEIMKNNGINYWHGGMVGGGQRWRDVWTAKAEEAVALVFIISATFMESQACQQEMFFVADVLKKGFIPILYGGPVLTQPFRMILSTSNWIDNQRVSWQSDLLVAVRKIVKVGGGVIKAKDDKAESEATDERLDKLRKEAKREIQKLSAGTSIVFVGGSTKFFSEKSEPLMKKIGECLAKCDVPITLATGGMSGIGEATSKAFLESGGSKVVHILPTYDPSDHSFRAPQDKNSHRFYSCSFGDTIFFGESVAEREKITAGVAQVHILAEGGPGARKEAELALEKGTLVIPIGVTGGAAIDIKVDKPESVDTDLWEKLKDESATDDEIANAAVSCVIAAAMEHVEHKDKTAKDRVCLSFGQLVHQLNSFSAVYVIEGHGSVQGYDGDMAGLASVCRSITVELNSRHGKGKWAVLYGGDACNEESLDVGALVKLMKAVAGCFVAAITNDIVEPAFLADENEEKYHHIDSIFFVRTEKYRDGSGQERTYWGGFHSEIKRLLVGPAAAMFHPKLIHGVGQPPKSGILFRRGLGVAGTRPSSASSNDSWKLGAVAEEGTEAIAGFRTSALKSYPASPIKGVLAFGGGQTTIDDCEYAVSIGLPVYYKAMKAKNRIRGEYGAIENWAKMRLIKEGEWSLRRKYVQMVR